MKKRAQLTLAVLAFSTLLGCNPELSPTSTPATEQVEVTVYSTRSAAPLLETFSVAYEAAYPSLRVNTGVSSYADLMTRLKDGEIAYFISHHLPADPTLWAAPLAQDALTIIVNQNNPINDLTADQLRRLYQGHVTQWIDVGGAGEDVTLFSRERGSALQHEFNRLIMGQRRTSPNAIIVPTDISAANRVESVEGGIAYVPFSAMPDGVKQIVVNDVAPSTDTIRNNSYPLRMTLFIIGLEEPEAQYRAFIGWAQSPDAQSLIGERYIPLP